MSLQSPVRGARLCSPSDQPVAGDLALHFQHAGEWSEVVQCYEFQLQRSPQQLEAQTDLLSVQLAAGQLRSALLMVEGLMIQQPEHTAVIAGLGVSAAWRLSDWDAVERLTKLAEPTSGIGA